jgi:hypothetical protein
MLLSGRESEIRRARVGIAAAVRWRAARDTVARAQGRSREGEQG